MTFFGGRWRAVGTTCPWLRPRGDGSDPGPNLKGLAPDGSMLGGRHDAGRGAPIMAPRPAWPISRLRISHQGILNQRRVILLKQKGRRQP